VHSSYILTYVHLVPLYTGSVDNVSICRMDTLIPSDMVFVRVVSKCSFSLMWTINQGLEGGPQFCTVPSRQGSACGVGISVCPFQVIFICFVGTQLMDVFKQSYLHISLLCYSVHIINSSWKKIMCLTYEWSFVFGCNLNNYACKNVYFPTWSDSM